MKSIILLTIAIAALFCLDPVEAIRSAVVSSSLLASSDRKRSQLLTIRGGGSDSSANASGNAAVVSVVPEETLPRAISGMSAQAFRFEDTSGARGHERIDASSTAANTVPPPATAATFSLSPPVSTGATLLKLPECIFLKRQYEGGYVETETADVAAEPSEDLAMKSVKWSGLRNRVLSTIGMIASLGALSYYFKEDGLSLFVVVLQAMMYREMTGTIGGDDWGSVGVTLRKYWWFATAVIAWNGPRVYPWMRMKFEAVAFGMTVTAGIVTSILGFQHKKSGNADFREYIRQTAVSLLSAILVIFPSSFWIGTLEEHGMKWIFAPAAFVAINDIMAYVFGKLLGKHPLLPSISPNKTWEGFLGAALSTMGAAWVGLGCLRHGGPLIGPGTERRKITLAR
eukprot:jgi/Psemu1/290570/fgenesh1_pg.514_\